MENMNFFCSSLFFFLIVWRYGVIYIENNIRGISTVVLLTVGIVGPDRSLSPLKASHVPPIKRPTLSGSI